MNDDVCCLPLDTSLWDEKSFEWKDKLFLQDQVVQFLHIPLNMTSVVKRMFAKIEAANAMPDRKDFLMLCYDPSPWKSEIYMTISKDVPGGKVARLSGTFLSKVFDGPYHHVPKWIKVMDAYVADKGFKVKKYFFHFAYCPKCMKKYGKNHAIAFAQVK